MPGLRMRFGSGPIELEGVLHMPSECSGLGPGVVMCHPHPLYGGDMDNSIVLAVCDRLASTGIAALRFNFRGTGRSEGAHDSGKGEQDDVLAALQTLGKSKGIDARRIGLAGYSFGAGVALAAGPRSGEVKALAAIAPPVRATSVRPIETWKKPTLVIVGDEDSFIPVKQVQDLVDSIATQAELVVLPGADHFLLGYEAKVAERVVRFFADHLAR